MAKAQGSPPEPAKTALLIAARGAICNIGGGTRPAPERMSGRMKDAGAEKPATDGAEVEKFSALAAEWWKPGGRLAVLHAFNPARVRYIREQAAAVLDRDPAAERPLEGLRALDIGCGGGILSEALAALGARVCALDPSPENIRVARAHARERGLRIDYRVSTAGEMATEGGDFDLVLAMEVLEHVPAPADFLRVCAGLVRPGGLMICATINRTAKSFALAIIAAEYVLGWVPKGSHKWENFITPGELKGWLREAGLTPVDETGVVYSLSRDEWRLSRRDTGVNYLMAATRPPAPPARRAR